MTELLRLQFGRAMKEECAENFTSPEELDWLIEYRDFEEELRMEAEEEMYERDMATDDYRFRHRLGEYEGWNDDDALGDFY